MKHQKNHGAGNWIEGRDGIGAEGAITPGTRRPRAAREVLEARLQKRLQAIHDRLEHGAAAARTRRQPNLAAATAEHTGPPLPTRSQAHDGWANLLAPNPDEAAEAANLVLHSAFIQQNALYRARAQKVRLWAAFGEPSVNAFATDRTIEDATGAKLEGPLVVLLGGMAAALNLVAAAATVAIRERSESLLRFTCHDLGRTIRDHDCRLEPKEAVQIFERNLRFRAESQLQQDAAEFAGMAQALRLSMLMHVFAHELGHLALGHTLGEAPNSDVKRNQEREADSFASSALSSCPHPQFHFLGEVLSKAIFVWLHRGMTQSAQDTHPHARERFHNTFAANSTAARETDRAFGLDQNRLGGLLPLTD